MSRWVRIDLHVHTGLSPLRRQRHDPVEHCSRGTVGGIHLLAITDHNCTLNAGAVIEVGTELGLVVLRGWRCKQGEVHLIAIFPTFDVG